ncbi:glycoside hydrolase family 75 protein [Streptomyces sp. NPDC059861]|uniref:glycoside hydrolase family 75 protein n=1 Tax=Streptomyces sp. NPDC059861 TaxID=3346974 RepID=UPI003662B240
MRVQSLALAAASAALLAPATSSTAHPPKEPRTRHERSAESPVRADELLAAVRDCTPLSGGRYRTDAGSPATVPVCGTRDAVFWTADMDIDCDGRPGRHCNRRTDPYFSAGTAFQASDGRHLNAERLPFVVVPVPSRIWDYREHGVRDGSVVALVHGDRVQYAVVGDTGPHEVIGEASYAAAEALGISPDPRGGGTDSGVTYVVFKGSRISPIENQAAAAAEGQRLARRFVDGGQPRG